MPLVCVCIPSYNAEATIAETLASILSQTYRNFKVIVLDNASTDRTVSIVSTFKDPRLTIHQNAANIGAVKNFDLCIEMAEGKYTAIFHADEVYEKEMLEKQVAVLEHSPQVGAVFPEASLIDDKGRFFGETRVAQYVGYPKEEIAIFGFDELFPAILRSGNFLLCSGAMVRTEIYKTEIRFWDSDKFSTSCDLDVWLRILEHHPIALILQKLMRTRTTQTQASFQELKRNTQRADMFLVLDYYLEKNRSRGIIKNRGIAAYEALQRMDIARRAMNLYLTAQGHEARALLRDIPMWALFRFAFDAKRGLLTFLLIIYLKTMLLLRLDTLGARVLRFIADKTKR